MKSSTDIGMNRTGMGMSPLQSKELVQGALDGIPSSLGDEAQIASLRTEYVQEAEPIGTIPPPATIKGVAETVVQMVKGQKMGVLLDKLGERLAFERTGTRLYQALIVKFNSYASWTGGPTHAQLNEFYLDELRHFEMLRKTIEELGADSTVQTPSADISGTAAQGIVQVIADPRTTLAQSLHAILIAELADNDGWAMLITLCQNLGMEDLANRFALAHQDEDKHLKHVRFWLSSHVVGEGTQETVHQA